MLKSFSQSVGIALSLVAVIGPETHAETSTPAWCWPYCDYDLECQYWFGQNWYYCGYNSGWVYCCTN